MLIVAVALSPCRAVNGCIRGIPGSHNGPLLPHKEAFGTSSLLSREEYIDAPIDEAAAVDFEFDAGEAALFNNAICHSSNPNTGDDRRIVFLVEMIPPTPTSTSHVSRRRSFAARTATATSMSTRSRSQNLGAAEAAAWERAVAIQASVLFRGAERPPRALSGMTSGASPTGD